MRLITVSYLHFELSSAVARAFKITHLCKRHILHLQGYTFLYRFLDLFSFFKAAKWSSNNPFGISYEMKLTIKSENEHHNLENIKIQWLAVIENAHIHDIYYWSAFNTLNSSRNPSFSRLLSTSLINWSSDTRYDLRLLYSTTTSGVSSCWVTLLWSISSSTMVTRSSIRGCCVSEEDRAGFTYRTAAALFLWHFMHLKISDFIKTS